MNNYDDEFDPPSKEDLRNSKQLRDFIRQGKIKLKDMSDLERQYLIGYVPSAQRELLKRNK